MTSTIIGLFDTPAQAEQARSAITALNTPPLIFRSMTKPVFSSRGEQTPQQGDFSKVSHRPLGSARRTRLCTRKAFDAAGRS